MSTSSARAFEPRHVHMARAAFAAIAAIMITFSADHSAALGLAVFSGFAIATGLVLALAAWLVAVPGRRWPYAAMAAVSLLAGMAAGVPPWRSTGLFFALVIVWGFGTGLIELIAGLRARRVSDVPAGDARDAIVVGALGLVLAAAIALVPAQYALTYVIEIEEVERSFTLTGITIAVGVLGAYAAIIAVYLGIGAFSPRPVEVPAQKQERA